MINFRTSVEQLVNEVQTLDDRIQKIGMEIELPAMEADIKDQMKDFLKVSILSVFCPTGD